MRRLLRRKERVFATLLLATTGLLMLFSANYDSLTSDESLYLPTGYYYLTEQKANIGYEHPPLIRDLAAVPLLLLNLKPASALIAPETLGNLEQAVWTFGDRFVYEQSESPERILIFGRLAMVFLTLLLGHYLFNWTRKEFGSTTAILSLSFYALSPFFLAHGRFVTMDVPSALGCFAMICVFYRYLRAPTKLNVFLSGLTLGFCLLIKFPLLTLIPFLIFMNAFWIWAQQGAFDWKPWGLRFVGVLSAALLVIYLVYAFHLVNYPQEQHVSDIQKTYQLTRPYAAGKLAWVSGLAELSLFRPLAHYLYGVSWQFSRSGAFSYFMGEGSFTSWLGYYPFGYLAKTPLAFHLLALLALFFNWRRFKQGAQKKVLESFWSLSALAWIAYYLFILCFVNSGNTGSRYLIPVLPFVFVLVAKSIATALNEAADTVKPGLLVLLACLISFQAASVWSAHPSYLSYFSEWVGGAERGANFLVDTDVDWGQDKRRLAAWVKAKGIGEIYVANSISFQSAENSTPQPFSFNSRDFRYYLGAAYRDYSLAAVPFSGWLAVPARILKWGQTVPAARQGWSSHSYDWLKELAPVEIIGGSIWVFYVK